MTTDNSLEIVNVIAKAISVIEQDGEFRGNSNTGYAGDVPGYRSTKDKVVSHFKSPTPETYEERIWTEAKEVLDYFRNRAMHTNDFMTNLIVLSKSDEIIVKNIGYIVAMVPTYRKQQMKDAIASEYANSDYLGVVGKRREFFLKLIERQYIQSMECSLFTFIDRRKNLVKTWVSADKVEQFNMSEGDCVDLTAFVRKHEKNKYNNLRETIINRVKIVENKGKA